MKKKAIFGQAMEHGESITSYARFIDIFVGHRLYVKGGDLELDLAGFE